MNSLNVNLASTLLDCETETPDEEQIQPDRNEKTRIPFRTGIKTLDRDLPAALWTSGKVIGIGHVHGEKLRQAENGKNLAVELIATHLIDTYRARESQQISTDGKVQTTVYLVTAAASTTISQIYNSVMTRLKHEHESRENLTKPKPPKRSIAAFIQPSNDRTSNDRTSNNPQTTTNESNTQPSTLETQALSMLEHVSLLQHLDQVGLTESLSEISTSLALHTETPSTKQSNVLLYIEGLNDAISTAAQRTSTTHPNPGRARNQPSNLASRISQPAALTSQIIRWIRRLSRTRIHGTQILTLLEVNVSLDPSGRQPPAVSGIYSSFANDGDHPLTWTGHGGSLINQGSAGPRMNTYTHESVERVLFGIMQGGVDTIVLVHDGFKSQDAGEDKNTKTIVEVVRDSYSGGGCGVGSWAVWT